MASYAYEFDVRRPDADGVLEHVALRLAVAHTRQQAEARITLPPDHRLIWWGRKLPVDTGKVHGPEPHPELHARCRNCRRRWPEHDELHGHCPEDR